MSHKAVIEEHELSDGSHSYSLSVFSNEYPEGVVTFDCIDHEAAENLGEALVDWVGSETVDAIEVIDKSENA